MKYLNEFIHYLLYNPLVLRFRLAFTSSQGRKKQLKNRAVSFPLFGYLWVFLIYRNIYFIKTLYCKLFRPKKIKISIIIPTYNARGSVRKAFDSVIQQKVDFNFKIIFTDDASTDGTQEVLKGIQSEWPDVVELVLRDKNKGIPNNQYETVVNRVDSEYFTILDDDDYWTDLNKLQTQIDTLDRNLYCSICSHVTRRIFDLEGKMYELFPKVKAGIYHFPINSHVSSKVFRWTYINFISKKNEPALIDDSANSKLALVVGTHAFIDKEMSVYTDLGKGVWTGKDKEFQKELALIGNTRIYKYSYGCFVKTKNIDFDILKRSKYIAKLEEEYSKK